MDRPFTIRTEAGTERISESQEQVLKCRGDIEAILSAQYVLSKNPTTAEEYAVRMLNDLSSIVKGLRSISSEDIDAEFRSNLLALVSPTFELLEKAPKNLLEDLLILIKEVQASASEKDRMYKTLMEKPLSALISQLEAKLKG